MGLGHRESDITFTNYIDELLKYVWPVGFYREDPLFSTNAGQFQDYHIVPFMITCPTQELYDTLSGREKLSLKSSDDTLKLFLHSLRIKRDKSLTANA